jgi:chemotaxis protein methyltransferase CheR
MTPSDTDYDFLRKLVLSESSNQVDPSRNTLFDTRLTPIVKLAGASDLQALVNILKTDQPARLHRAVAEAMTINETSFFRDARPFDTIRTTILPRLIALRRPERRLRLWSAAASSGQEAYSLAILIREHFPELADWDVRIVGTDISHEMTQYAQRACYRRLEVNRGLPARMLLKYFTRDKEEWQVNALVRSMCEFRQGNLCAELSSLPTFDLVLLRNVLLYFPQPERTKVLRTVHRQMQARGYLLLGSAEQAEDSSDLFRVEFAEGSYFYRSAAEG